MPLIFNIFFDKNDFFFLNIYINNENVEGYLYKKICYSLS